MVGSIPMRFRNIETIAAIGAGRHPTPTLGVMRDAVAVIAEQLAQWETPFVEPDIFATGDPERIFAAVDAFVRRTLHASIAGYLFQATSISSVHGVALDDGREVVVKAKPPAATNPGLPLDRASLEAIVAAQRTLHAAGFPCPRPLVGPLPLGAGLATIETYLPPADPAPRWCSRGASSSTCSCSSIAPLHCSASHCRAIVCSRNRDSKLFQPSEADTAWVRDVASRARAIAEAEPSRLVLAHGDWRVEHVKARGDQIVATYDWDSLAVLPETRIVGIDAHGHIADWSQSMTRNTPTYDDVVGFIADYEAARGDEFTPNERRAARAWAAYFIAYQAWLRSTWRTVGCRLRGPPCSKSSANAC